MKRQRKLEKHPNGQYRVRISRSGVSKSFFLGTNEKTARKKLKDIERDIASGRISFSEQDTTASNTIDGKKDLRLEELAVRHLRWVKTNRSEQTFKLRQRYVQEFVDFIGPCMVSDLTRIQLEDFYNQAKVNGKTPNSGNHQLRNVKTMLLWGEEMELIDLPFKRFPKARHIPPKTKRVNENDLVILLNKVPKDFKDMILFGLLTGLRPNELRELTQEQVRISQDVAPYILIEGHKTAKTAGEAKPRTVPLSPTALEIVERQIQNHPNSENVFLNENGDPYTRYTYRNRMIRWCRRAKVNEITPYALRHTFASIESDAGVETTALARLMGHSQTRTLERYVTNSFEAQRKAVEKVESRLMKVAGE